MSEWIEPVGDGGAPPPPVEPDEPPKPKRRREHPKVRAVWDKAATDLERCDLTTDEGAAEALRISRRAERLSRTLRRALRHAGAARSTGGRGRD